MCRKQGESQFSGTQGSEVEVRKTKGCGGWWVHNQHVLKGTEQEAGSLTADLSLLGGKDCRMAILVGLGGG